MKRLSEVKKAVEKIICGDRVVYHHIPKCGGTSIERALRRRYPISYSTFPLSSIYNAVDRLNPLSSKEEIDEITARFREVQLLSLMYQDIHCIAGHVYFSEIAYEEFHDKYRFITVLRDPIDFFRSFYTQVYNAKDPRWKVDLSLPEFLETPQAVLFGKFYALYLAGYSIQSDEKLENAIERSKNNLKKFSAVGFLEEMPRFQKQLKDLLGVKISIGHANKSREKAIGAETALDSDIRQRIEQLSQANREIYEFARRECRD